MENQGKRLLLAVGLALAVLLGWNMLFPPEKKEEPPKPAPGSAAVVPPTAPGATPGTPATPATPAEPEKPRAAEQTTALVAPGRFTATFSSYGGSLRSWQLDDPRFQNDKTKGELLPARADAGSFFVCILDSQCDVARPPVWDLRNTTDTSVTYTRSTASYDLEKTFTIVPDAYLVNMQLKVTAKRDQAAPQRLAIVVYGAQDPKDDDGKSAQVAPRVWRSSTMTTDDDDEIRHTPIRDIIGAPRWEDSVQWTGFEHPYLLAGYAPQRADTARIEKKTWAGAEWLGPGAGDLMRTDILFPPVVVKADSVQTYEVTGYLGPKNYKELEAAEAASRFPLEFTETVDFGWFAVIGRPLLWLLLKFQSVVGNWAIAIMMLTFLVKLATLYWTNKSMRSMKAMAALAPQMKALQEKYKEDRQRLQVETMALYKQHNVNPLAGCLPILLQMPIWIALYRMLSSAGELYQEPFIPGWIDDLTNTDPYYILPIILMATMFAQARMQPATGDSRQQKFLQYGMPLMFGVMSFFFPSGLTVYIFTNTVLSALHSLYMNKYDKKSMALTAQMKKNAEAAAAAKSAPAGGQGAAKDAAKGGAKGGKGAAKGGAKGGSKPKPAAQKVLDAESTEVATDGDGTAGAPRAASNPARPKGAGGKSKKPRP